jgi:hypothetical protein
MLPSERRDMFGGFRSHVTALTTQLGKSAFQIHRVPKNNGGDQNVEAGGAVATIDAGVDKWARSFL